MDGRTDGQTYRSIPISTKWQIKIKQVTEPKFCHLTSPLMSIFSTIWIKKKCLHRVSDSSHGGNFILSLVYNNYEIFAKTDKLNSLFQTKLETSQYWQREKNLYFNYPLMKIKPMVHCYRPHAHYELDLKWATWKYSFMIQ